MNTGTDHQDQQNKRTNTVKNLEDYTTAGAILLVLLLTIATSWWWFSQKWQACKRLYDNKPAQIVCTLASK
ncbi:MAG: hypothetical protein EBT12_16785 [Marivivens sp.]|nr:hypothetical protein [Marivivens sp.]